MKSFAFISALIFAANAYSFSNVTLNRDIALKTSSDRPGIATHWSIEGNGSKYCYVKLETTAVERNIVKEGTILEIYQVLDDHCEFDLSGRSCAVSFLAENRELELKLGVTCIEKGMLASPITAKKATRFTKGFLTIK